jgi:hypothetical protein
VALLESLNLGGVNLRHRVALALSLLGAKSAHAKKPHFSFSFLGDAIFSLFSRLFANLFIDSPPPHPKKYRPWFGPSFPTSFVTHGSAQ